MLPAHTAALATARTALALLADQATTLEASSGYEQALIQLDGIHANEVPALNTVAVSGDQHALCVTATAAIRELVVYEVDELDVELTLAMLDEAHASDGE